MKKVLNKIMYVTVGTLTSSLAFAAQNGGGVGDRVSSWMDEIGIFGDFLMVVAFFIGLILGVNGLLQIKAWADNPQQNKLTKPLIYAVVGAFLMGYTVYTGLISNSVVGEDVDNKIDGMSKF